MPHGLFFAPSVYGVIILAKLAVLTNPFLWITAGTILLISLAIVRNRQQLRAKDIHDSTEAEKFGARFREICHHRPYLCMFGLFLIVSAIWLLIGLFPFVIMYFATEDGHKVVGSFATNPDMNSQRQSKKAGPPPDQIAESLSSFLGGAGAIGDAYGAINSFFSTLALAGALVSIYLQSRELSLQREQMVRMADAQSNSDRSLVTQARVAAYNHLADYQRTLSETADTSIKKARAVGRYRGYADKLQDALGELESAEQHVFLENSYNDVAAEFFYCNSCELQEQFQREQKEALDPKQSFRPVQEIMLRLATEIAWIQVRLELPLYAATALGYADGLIAGIISENPDSSSGEPNSGGLRTQAIANCWDCFSLIHRAGESLEEPTKFEISHADLIRRGYHALLRPT